MTLQRADILLPKFSKDSEQMKQQCVTICDQYTSKRENCIKKSLLIVATIILLLLCCCLSANAAEVLYSGTCGTSVTWELDSDGLLTIKGTGSMTHQPWSTYASMIKTCVIEQGVTTISSNAFTAI